MQGGTWLILALISCCIYNSTATSNMGDSNKFLSCWLVLWRQCVSVFYLRLHSFVLVSSKWDKPRRKWWMRVKKSNYRSTSMMERRLKALPGFCCANCRHRLPTKGIQPPLRTFWLCVWGLVLRDLTFSMSKKTATLHIFPDLINSGRENHQQ